MTEKQPSGCPLCNDGGCLLCQLRAPVEAGVSSSYGVLVDTVGGNMGDGNSRAAKKGTGSGDSGYGGANVNADPDYNPLLSQHYCTLCGLDFKDLFHHYSQHHPGAKAHAPRGSCKT